MHPRTPTCALALRVLVLALAGSVGCDAAVPLQPTRPNIVLFVVDTLRADEIGCYGARVTQTPAIDAFAAESVRFENARSPSSWTRPALASLLTGVPPAVHGIATFADHLASESHSLRHLPELMRGAGYHTAAVVTNPQLDPSFGFSTGFDVYDVLYGERTGAESRYDPETIAAPVVIDAARRSIEKAPDDRPFFLFVLAIDPHGPYEPPPPYDAMYDPGAARETGTRNFAGALARYRGEVSYLDAAFGDFVAWLRARHLLERTLFVLTSDHGEEFGEHGGHTHGKTLYDEVVRIPLLLRWPGARPEVRPGVRFENVDLLDVSVTVARAAGADPPEGWNGRDLRGSLEPRPVFSTSQLRDDFHFTSIVSGTDKLIRNDRTGETALFDLAADPAELRPAPDEATSAELLAALEAFRNRGQRLRNQLPTGGPKPEVPAQIRERLEALGYGDSDPPAAYSPHGQPPGSE